MTKLRSPLFSILVATAITVAFPFAEATECHNKKLVTSGSQYFNANFYEQVCKDTPTDEEVQQNHFSVCISFVDRDAMSFWNSAFRYSCVRVLLKSPLSEQSEESNRVELLLNSFQDPNENTEIRKELIQVADLIFLGKTMLAETKIMELIYPTKNDQPESK